MTVGTDISTRDRILQAAFELFAAQGYEKTSLSEIADRLGITKAALYYHFPAKDELLTTLVSPLLERVDTLLANAPRKPLKPNDRRALLENYLDLFIEFRRLVTTLANDRHALNHPDLGERIRTQNRAIPVLLSRSDRRQDVVRASCAVGCIQVGILHLDGEDCPDDVRATILEAAEAALSPRSARRNSRTRESAN